MDVSGSRFGPREFLPARHYAHKVSFLFSVRPSRAHVVDDPDLWRTRRALSASTRLGIKEQRVRIPDRVANGPFMVDDLWMLACLLLPG